MNSKDPAVAKDLASQIHPFTDLARHREVGPFVIERGSGVYVFDTEGRSYIEGMSGLWSCALGFGHPRLIEAAIKQLQKLPYYHSFSHKAHAPAIELASKLAALCPGDLNHVFFTNSGSEAADTIIKIVWYINNALGRPAKKKFLSRVQGYHGSTIGAGSLTGIPAIHRDFDLPAIPVHHLTCPYFYRLGRPEESEIQFTERLARELEETIAREGPETIAAFIGEPLIAAGGVIPPPEGYWKRVQEICRRNDILVVVDEVVTAFGRLGTMFGSERYGIKPDIMMVSKQITSSYQPLAAVVVSDQINELLVQQSKKLGTFVHGSTTTGHPVATAVALENIAVIEQENLVQNARNVGEKLQVALREFSTHPLVGDVRGVGLIAGVELVADKATRGTFKQRGAVGAYFFRRAHDHGLIIRSIQDTIAICPPLILTEKEVGALLTAFGRTLDDTTKWVTEQNIQ